MKTLVKSGVAAFCACAALGALAMVAPSSVEARPNYKNEFAKKYSKVKNADCKICHPDDNDRSQRNEYGKAVEKALAATKVKDAKKIQKALDKAGEEKGADGKKFSEKAKKGDRPAG
jgi:hypothetical protein